MSKVVDTYMAYRFIKILTTPWKKLPAYELGIIDENGKKIKSPETPEEKDAYNHFNRLVFNIKRIINKAPGGKSSIASYGSALYLLKERYGNDLKDENMFEELLSKYLNEKTGDKKEYQNKVKKLLKRYNVDSPEDLSSKEKKKFFNTLDRIHVSDKEMKEDGPTNVASQANKKDLPLGKKRKQRICDEDCIKELAKDMEEEFQETIEENLSNVISLARGFSGQDDITLESVEKVFSLVQEGKVFKKVVRDNKVVKKAFCTGENQRLSGGKCVNKDSKFKQSERKSVKKRKRTLQGKSLNQSIRKRLKSIKKSKSISGS